MGNQNAKGKKESGTGGPTLKSKMGNESSKQSTQSTAQLTPHIAAKATARDAIAAFGAGYGYLLEPVEWRVTEYLRKDYLYAIGGNGAGYRTLSTVECYDASINVWSPWNIASLTTA